MKFKSKVITSVIAVAAITGITVPAALAIVPNPGLSGTPARSISGDAITGTADAAALVRLAHASPDPLTITSDTAGVHDSASGDFPGGAQEIDCVTGAQKLSTWPYAKPGTIIRGARLACSVTSDTGKFPGPSSPAAIAAAFRAHHLDAHVVNH